MKFRLLFIGAVFAAIILSTATGGFAVPKMAFGYLTNKSGDVNFNYLEKIFPNSFANSIRRIFNIAVVKPHQVDSILKNNNEKLEKNYAPYSLQELTEKLSSDYFIYGNFTPLPGDRIRIELNLYENGSNKMFSFTNVGRMETEIFKLVDRITLILKDFLGNENHYRTEIIPPGRKLAILTNIEGHKLNSLYSSFLKKGYRIAGFNGNTIYNKITEEEIDRFKFISAKNNSYDIITDTRNIKFKYGTWASKKHIESINYQQKIFKIYDFNFDNTRNIVLDKISAKFGGLSHLLIVGFNEDQTNAWVRCLNIGSRDLVWMQSNIYGSNAGEIGDKIIESMRSKVQTKFQQK